MDTSFIFKVIVVLLLLTILVSLASGMFYLIRDRGQSDRAVRSLTVRIALSITLFILLFIGLASGLIKPHGITQPPKTEKALP